MDRTIRVPLAVDATVRIPLGPMLFPLRAIVLVLLASPLAFVAMTLDFIPGTWRLGFIMFILLFAATMGIPMREGIWIGLWALYRKAHLVLPSVVTRGEAHRASVRTVGQTVEIKNVRGRYTTRKGWLSLLNYFAVIPHTSTEGPGILRLSPGGARAVLMVKGPAVSISSDSYTSWCSQLTSWILSLECPAQLITVMDHFDDQKAQAAFNKRTNKWPHTPLLEMERQLASKIAQKSLGLTHYVVFSPGLAGADGMPYASRLFKLLKMTEARTLDAERILNSAMRLASGFGLEVEALDRDDMQVLLAHTILGAREASVGDDTLRIGDNHNVVMTMTQVPPTIEVGTVVEAMMRTHARGITSLHIMPVTQVVARKYLHRRSAMLKYSMKKGGGDEIENQVALQDTTQVIAAIAQRTIKPCRIALTMSVSHPEKAKAVDAAERISGILIGAGFQMTPVHSPGFLPALALAPGTAPLGRSVVMTSDSVLLRMVPALGTPFSDITAPVIGINALTGAPAYFSIWTPPNHNLVIVGSSGAGKSVATKTLLTRHLMGGVSCVIIDPDSEYKPIMNAVGGRYFELGTDALNPFAVGIGVSPDAAAGLVLPILSVMGGDEKGVKDGRPIRRLPDEDQGWLHAELALFYQYWNKQHPGQEPLMENVIEFIDTEAKARALTPREAERCRIITARLRRFTQGKRATVFNRPSTFAVGNQPTAIGLRVFAMSYGADLTPALAVVLTATLAAIEKREGRMIVVVDEAHRITCDPDAGEVLGQMVRQARKYGAGVWMCSQKVEDFVHTDLGRTLAATASTKLILGTEEAAIEDVIEVFKLNREEISAITPMSQGRGVLLSGAERTVVQIVPGPALMALSDTSPTMKVPQTPSTEK